MKRSTTFRKALVDVFASCCILVLLVDYSIGSRAAASALAGPQLPNGPGKSRSLKQFLFGNNFNNRASNGPERAPGRPVQQQQQQPPAAVPPMCPPCPSCQSQRPAAVRSIRFIGALKFVSSAVGRSSCFMPLYRYMPCTVSSRS